MSLPPSQSGRHQGRNPAAALFLRLALLAAICVAATSPAVSADRLSTQDQADIARIETYLNSLRTMRSKFTQITSDNQVSKGTIYIERPRRLRLAYEQPPNIQVFVNGNWLIHVDTDLEAVSQIPVSMTSARFLVGDRLDLQKDVTVRRVIREPGRISIELTARDTPDDGVFSMSFLSKPLSLLRWNVVDAQGSWTAVILFAPEFNISIPEEVFRFDPARYEPEIQTP